MALKPTPAPHLLALELPAHQPRDRLIRVEPLEQDRVHRRCDRARHPLAVHLNGYTAKIIRIVERSEKQTEGKAESCPGPLRTPAHKRILEAKQVEERILDLTRHR